MKVIFFDTDRETRDYFRRHKLPKGATAVFFPESIQDVPLEKLREHKDAEAISIFVYSRFTDNLLKLFPKLKLINTRATGYNNIDLPYCKKNKIAVANVVGYGETTVAEYAFGLLLDLTRKIGISNAKLKAGIVDVLGDTGHDINGKTVGVIGTGAIGRHFCKLAKGFGCTVLAYDLYKNEELEKTGVVKYVSLDTIYKKSDIISLHCNATADNYRFINEAVIAKMKKGVYIINTARGELIDTVALYKALKSGHVAGAGLDVIEHENILIKNDIDLALTKSYDSLLYSVINKMVVGLDNVIITPHIAFNSVEAKERIMASSLNTLIAFAEGKEFKSVCL
ncbi:MAG: NAD(P)-binding domain-containing protein [Alphaproteobacteria bacterium]|nr:NAD(P)-binding domain-containing protein [Alphaproteobacteria bacterium]